MRSPNDKLIFESGQEMKNRFMLAPLTNTQSHEDGTLSDDEYKWLTKRAEGGFGITMSCASHVQEIGKGFPGQLGIFDDKHIDGLRKNNLFHVDLVDTYARDDWHPTIDQFCQSIQGGQLYKMESLNIGSLSNWKEKLVVGLEQSNIN